MKVHLHIVSILWLQDFFLDIHKNVFEEGNTCQFRTIFYPPISADDQKMWVSLLLFANLSFGQHLNAPNKCFSKFWKDYTSSIFTNNLWWKDFFLNRLFQAWCCSLRHSLRLRYFDISFSRQRRRPWSSSSRQGIKNTDVANSLDAAAIIF